jgi:hypothetical protein
VHDVDVVLNDGITGAEVDPVRAQRRVPGGEPERGRAADDGELADLVERAVPAEQRQRAAVELAGREDEVHGLQEAQLRLVRAHVQALRPAHGPRPRLRALRQRVVHHVHHPEHGHGRGVRRGDHPHRRGRLAAHRVVEVEVEVRWGGGGGVRARGAPPGTPTPVLELVVDRRGGGRQHDEDEEEQKQRCLGHCWS